MGTVIELRSGEVVDPDRINELLSRMEWRLDEPCTVPGCSHGGECRGDHGEIVVAMAA